MDYAQQAGHANVAEYLSVFDPQTMGPRNTDVVVAALDDDDGANNDAASAPADTPRGDAAMSPENPNLIDSPRDDGEHDNQGNAATTPVDGTGKPVVGIAKPKKRDRLREDRVKRRASAAGGRRNTFTRDDIDGVAGGEDGAGGGGLRSARVNSAEREEMMAKLMGGEEWFR